KPRVKTATPAGTAHVKSPRSGHNARSAKSRQPAPDKPGTANKNTTGTETSSNNPSSSSAGKTSPAQHARQQSSTPQGHKPLQPKTWMTPTLAAIVGAVGGAVLSLLFVIPLIMSGIFQPDTQADTRTRIASLQKDIDASQDLSAQNQNSLRSTDEQINILREDLIQQQTLLEDQTSRIARTQQEILARQNSQETALEEQTSSLGAQLAALNAIETPPVSIPFDPTPLQRQIADLGAKIDAVAAGASNEDAQKLSADITQVQTRLSALQTQLNQQLQGSDTQLSELATKLAQQGQELATINTLVARNTDQLSQQDMALGALSLTTAELLQATKDLQQTTSEITKAADAAAQIEPQSGQDSLSPQIQQIPFALMSIEIALNNGQPFLYQLESLAAQTSEFDATPELLHAAAEGLAVPDDIAAEFSRLIPVVLSARPGDPNANFIDRVTESIKSILGFRATGLENGDEFENILNQSLAAIKVSDFIEAQTLLGNLPSPMRDNLGQLNQQIGLHATIQSIMSTLNDVQHSIFSPPAPATDSTEASPPPQPTQSGPVSDQQNTSSQNTSNQNTSNNEVAS
ncbi:MAG: hypothetical protein L3J13_02315, partial [Devosiaceae bacterium]|nr:hypothetical protein [Devosiaceae bacterium]